MSKLSYIFSLGAVICLLTAGCSPEEADKKEPVGGTSAESHDDHDHDHEHGPHHGEVFEASDDLHVEVVPKYGDNLIQVYFYEEDLLTEKRVPVEKIVGSYTAGETKTVELEPVDAKDGKTHRFEVQDEGFAIARKTTGVKLEFQLDGEKVTVDVPKDPHSH